MRDASEVIVEDPIGIGTVFEAKTTIGPFRLRDRMEIIEWQPNHAMAVRHRGRVTGTGRFTLEPEAPDRTRILWEEQILLPWWLGGVVGEQIAAPILQRLFRANLDAFAARF